MTEISHLYIDIGHNSPPRDTGSPGVKFEDELTLELGMKLKEFIEKNSNVKVTCPKPKNSSSLNDSLGTRCESADSSGCDFFISLHFNAYNKSVSGTEVFIHDQESSAKPIAERVLKKLVSLGFSNRGLKVGNYYVIKNTAAKAILVEVCFCDSTEDMEIYNPDKVAEAIAEGLLNKDIPDISPVVASHISKPQLIKLTVLQDTLIKNSVDFSENLTDSEKKPLKKGEYKGFLIGDDEGHYHVNLDYIGEGFVYHGHSKIIVL